MHDDEDGSLVTRCAAWKKLGCGELVDCKEHHLLMNITDWHRHPKPRLQSTWRRLIKLLLLYRGLPAGTEAIRIYQRDQFGTSRGETCVVDLSSLAAKNLKSDRDRTLHRSPRIATLRKRIEDHKPDCVVLYGVDPLSRLAWNSLVGTTIEVGELQRIMSSRVVLVTHPQDHVTDEAWLRNAACLQ